MSRTHVADFDSGKRTVLRLVGTDCVGWQDRAHFFGVSAQFMPRILVDAARAQASVKRGGRPQRVAHSAAVDFDEMPDTYQRATGS